MRHVNSSSSVLLYNNCLDYHAVHSKYQQSTSHPSCILLPPINCFMKCCSCFSRPALAHCCCWRGQTVNTEPKKRIFNYRLSRARRIIENTFGIMAQRWRILRRPFKAKDENITKITGACVILHNFVMSEPVALRTVYCQPGLADYEDWNGHLIEGSWRSEDNGNGALLDPPATGHHSTRCAPQVQCLVQL